MKLGAVALLLSLSTTALGAVARVQVRVPAAAASGAGLAAPPLNLPLLGGGLQASAFNASALIAPALTVAPALAPANASALSAPVSVLAPAAAPRLLSAPPAAAPQEAARAAFLATLQRHGALSAEVGRSGGASEADSNFRAAAGLGDALKGHDGGLSVPADSPSFGDRVRSGLFGAPKKTHDHRKWRPDRNDPLYARLLEKVKLEDRGSARERAGLERVVRRMLESPTARKFAEQFVAEGIEGVIQFDEVPGSQVYEFERRKIFYAPRAFTDWKDGKAVVRLNRDYLDSDEEYFFEDAPPTLAHELLGHGLWYGRMAKVGLQDGFHVHENNETNAKLVGWLSSWELNRRHHDTYAYEYLQDPVAYLRNLKMRQPYYSVTYATRELGDVLTALRGRLAQVPGLREGYERALANIASWTPIVDHFIAHHGVPEARFAKLREDLAQRDAAMRGELETLKVIERSVADTIDYYSAEKGQAGLAYLRSMGDAPEFARLQADVDAMTAELRRKMTAETARPGPAPLPWPQGQITWDEFQAMFQKDARDNPSHWVQK